MQNVYKTSKPSKEERKLAMESYNALAEALEQVHSENPEIEIEETRERIRIPLKALKLLAKILKETSEGRPVSIIPMATEMTTQAAADFLGCSRPHLIKLLDKGEINFSKVGRHRRIKFEDLVAYKKRVKAEREKLIIEIMQADEESGLYDT